MFLQYFFIQAILLLSQFTIPVLSMDNLGHCQKSGCRTPGDAPPTKTYKSKTISSPSEVKVIEEKSPLNSNNASGPRGSNSTNRPKYRLVALLTEWILVFSFLRIVLYAKYNGLKSIVRRMRGIKSSFIKNWNLVMKSSHRNVSALAARVGGTGTGGGAPSMMSRRSDRSLGSLADLIGSVGWDDEETKSEGTGFMSEGLSVVSSTSSGSQGYSSGYSSYYSDGGYSNYSETDSDVSTLKKGGHSSGYSVQSDTDDGMSSSSLNSSFATAASDRSSLASLMPVKKYSSKGGLLNTHYETDENSYSSNTSIGSSSYGSLVSMSRFLPGFMGYFSAKKGKTEDKMTTTGRKRSPPRSGDNNTLGNDFPSTDFPSTVGDRGPKQRRISATSGSGGGSSSSPLDAHLSSHNNNKHNKNDSSHYSVAASSTYSLAASRTSSIGAESSFLYSGGVQTMPQHHQQHSSGGGGADGMKLRYTPVNNNRWKNNNNDGMSDHLQHQQHQQQQQQNNNGPSSLPAKLQRIQYDSPQASSTNNQAGAGSMTPPLAVEASEQGQKAVAVAAAAAGGGSSNAKEEQSVSLGPLGKYLDTKEVTTSKHPTTPEGWPTAATVADSMTEVNLQSVASVKV